MFDPTTGKAHPRQAPPPAPEPEHQQKITREKWFEIISVMLLIIGGMAFLMWRNGHNHERTGPVNSVAEAAIRLETRGLTPTGKEKVGGREFSGYQKSLHEFECNVDLTGRDTDAPLETAMLWLQAKSADPAPAGQAVQDAVNEVSHLASVLVPAAEEAIQKAVHTSERLSDGPRSYDKGVAATNDGWKVTYVTYATVENTQQPVLVLVLQSLDAGSDPALGEFNRTLYQSIARGISARSAFDSAPGETKPPSEVSQ